MRHPSDHASPIVPIAIENKSCTLALPFVKVRAELLHHVEVVR